MKLVSPRTIFVRTNADRHKKLEDNASKRHKKRKGKKDVDQEMIRKLISSGTTSTALSTDIQDDNMPRIGPHLSTEELQEEAMARGMDRQSLPLRKVDLLNLLVDGSIHLKKTTAWKKVERLRAKMEADCNLIVEEEAGNHQRTFDNTASITTFSSNKEQKYPFAVSAAHQQDPFAPFGLQIPHEQKELTNNNVPPAKSLRFDIKQESSLMDVTTLQTTLPSMYSTWPDRTFSFQSRNESGLTRFLRMSPFDFTMTCGAAINKVMDNVETKEMPSVTCRDTEKNTFLQPPSNEFDEIFSRHKTNTETKGDVVVPMSSSLGSLGSLDTQRSTRKEHWDAFRQFEPWIITPPPKNKVPDGSSKKGFTVWCSISSDLASSSSEKLFDSTYKKMTDANDRARYLFYWKNPWGMTPQKMSEVVHIKSDTSSNTTTASTFHCVNPNAETWIVSVVNDATFLYLDNARHCRHNLDSSDR
mgnify:CR=1 FL=1